GVIRPIRPSPVSTNQSAPSGPAVIPPGCAPAGRSYSVNVPSGDMRPIAAAVCSVNQMLPPRPNAIPTGLLFGVGIRYSRIAGGVTRRSDAASRRLRMHQALEEGERAGLVEEVVQVAALRALHARRAAVVTRAAGDHPRGV